MKQTLLTICLLVFSLPSWGGATISGGNISGGKISTGEDGNKESKVITEIKDDIILITQFYISLNKERHKEIQECLEFNLNNNIIDKIYLM